MNGLKELPLKSYRAFSSPWRKQSESSVFKRATNRSGAARRKERQRPSELEDGKEASQNLILGIGDDSQ
jgi:hypothetical protein